MSYGENYINIQSYMEGNVRCSIMRSATRREVWLTTSPHFDLWLWLQLWLFLTFDIVGSGRPCSYLWF